MTFFYRLRCDYITKYFSLMKFIQRLLAFVLLATLSCTPEDTNDTLSVSITASGLSDNKLALNNMATFSADISDYDGDITTLSYRWSLSTERGALSDGNNTLANPSVTQNTIYCLGQTAGDERIKVEVLDADNTVLGSETLDFEIVGFIDPEFPRGCYDQPKLIYSRGFNGHVCNFDGTGQQPLAFSGGLSVAISPDGEWLASNPYVFQEDRYNMTVARCDGSDEVEIPYQFVDGNDSDYIPHFSPDSKTVYFMRPNPNQDFPTNSGGFSDIYAYDVETGEGRFVTSLWELGESVGYFSVSPVTGDIAILRQSYEFFPDGSYNVTHKLSIVQPQTGLITDFTTLPSGRYDYGMDYHPNGGDIIFCATTAIGRGIFRINLTDGSQPLLVLEDPDPNTLPYNYCYYYDNGERIVFGFNSGNNNFNMYSTDANGNDFQLIVDIPGLVFLQGVLE
jgi:hypothetical protein